jgi:hypothetical protein
VTAKKHTSEEHRPADARITRRGFLREGASGLAVAAGGLAGWLDRGRAPGAPGRHAAHLDVRTLGIRPGTVDRAALDEAARRAVELRVPLFFPAGVYEIDDWNLISDLTVMGEGWQTVFLQAAAATWCVSINSGRRGTPDPSENVRNVTLRDLQLRGQVEALGFAEHVHLLNLNACTDVLVENVLFHGFRGDGCDVGSSNYNATERHNRNVRFRNCTFDGVNRQNRNGISFIDVDGAEVSGCTFRNMTREGMPGCIDVEPNPETLDFAIVRNVHIHHNVFEDCPHGNAVGLLLPPQSMLTHRAHGFRIHDNRITNCLAGLGFVGETRGGGASERTADYEVEFVDNRVSGCTRPFLLDGAKHVRIEGNTFTDCTGGAEIGYTTGVAGRDVWLRGNVFRRCGTENVNGLFIRSMRRLHVEGNTFDDCGLPGGLSGRSIFFGQLGAGSEIHLRRNLFLSPTGRTTYVIGVSSQYVLDIGSCVDEDNEYRFVTNSDFVGRGSYVSAPPSTGNWPLGAHVWNRDRAGGQPLGWRVVRTTPLTWAPIAAL